MLLFHRPGPDEMRRFVEGQAQEPFSYAPVGVTRGAKPAGWMGNHARVCLGQGRRTYRHARRALRAWRQYDMPWITLTGANAPPAEGATVGLLVRHFGFRSLHAARVVYTFETAHDGNRRTGFAYGTLPEHGERGEERFLVEWCADDSVWYELLAYSRPRHTWLAYPAARRLLNRFARDSTAAMARAVADSVQPLKRNAQPHSRSPGRMR